MTRQASSKIAPILEKGHSTTECRFRGKLVSLILALQLEITVSIVMLDQQFDSAKQHTFISMSPPGPTTAPAMRQPLITGCPMASKSIPIACSTIYDHHRQGMNPKDVEYARFQEQEIKNNVVLGQKGGRTTKEFQDEIQSNTKTHCTVVRPLLLRVLCIWSLKAFSAVGNSKESGNQL